MQYILSENELRDYQKAIAELGGANSILDSENRVLKSTVEKLQKQLNAVMSDFKGTEKTLAEVRQDLLAEKLLRQDVQEELQRCQKISAMRLEAMSNLQKALFCLKRERVCIATNPKTGTTKVVSVVKADTYRKFGWVVREIGLVDRPA